MAKRTSWMSDAPLVIAHRGASLLAPENTIAAFELALEMGADAIEFDVKLSCDGVPIIHHDMTLDRTTNGIGKVKEYPFAALRELDAGVKFDEKFKGERIPTLAEVLEQFQGKCLFNIELTNYNDPLDILPRRVLSCVEDVNAVGDVLVSSFNPIALWSIRKGNPRVRTALLLMPGTPHFMRYLLRTFTPHEDLHPHFKLVTLELVREVRNSGGWLNTWTVNEYSQLYDLFDLGIHGVITDDVESALRARKKVFM